MKAKTTWIIAAIVAVIVAVVLLVVLLPRKSAEPQHPGGNDSGIEVTAEPEPEPAEEPNTINGHKWVDMGSGIKWATTNIGANSPEEFGEYYAWGESAPKQVYDWEHYSHAAKNDEGYYTVSEKWLSSEGFIRDRKYDTASVLWGEPWRMPTYDEILALLRACTRTWTTMNDVNGYLLKSKTTGEELFFPASGYKYDNTIKYVGTHGYVWASNLSWDPDCGYTLYMKTSQRIEPGFTTACYGIPVRPVSD